MTATADDGSASGRPLAGTRVLECGGGQAVAYAGRLLADLGADVVVVEPPEGDALRARGPFVGGVPGPERSAAAAYLQADKRSVVLDGGPGGAGHLERLVAASDVVLRARDGAGPVPTDAQLAAARAADDGLVVADVSTFGATGPEAGEPGGDLMALAASGMLSLMSTGAADPDPVPLRYQGEVSSVYAACSAVVAVLGALHARLHHGAGQDLDVSAQEALVSVMATAVASRTYAGLTAVHDGRRGVCPWAIYPCRDGAVLVQCTEDGQWRALLGILGDPEWGDLELFDTTAGRVEQTEAVEALVAAAIAEHELEPFLEACHRGGVPASRVNTARDVLAWEQLTSRSFFSEIDLGDADDPATVRAAGSPLRLHDLDRPARRTAPRLGAHTGEVLAAWATPRRTAVPPDPRPGPATPPLAGVRVIDMTWVWAGPMAAMQLAHLGAEVIKVESSARIDVTRRLGPFADEIPGVDRSGYFNQYNQGKRSVCLNLADGAGRDLLRRLLASSDVVIDNMRAGALARMGFPYEHLRTLNPAIVAVSMTGFGESGPERDRLAYGSIIDALSGVVSITGPVDGPATDIPMSLPDPCAGLHAAAATLAALHRARRTGQGARVECSMIEAWMAAMPWGVLGLEAEGAEPARAGTRDPGMSPHGTFRCRGGYEWVAIAVEDDERFAALARALDRPDLAADPRFATLADRKAHEAELEREVTAWTSGREPEAAAAALRAAGVSARRVERMDEVVASPHLAARGFFSTFDVPGLGTRPLAGVPWRTSRSPMRAASPAPRLGEHTGSVLRDVLGLDDDEVAKLEAAGVLR